MKTKIDQKARAFKIWDILKYQAKNRKPITYGELAKKIDIHHRAVRFPLGLIQKYCIDHNLPPLNILVINKNSSKPGSGYIATTLKNIFKDQEKVFNFDWSKSENPFKK